MREGYFFLTGMLDDNTAELIITADGNLQNIGFVEELVKMAPNIPNWKITAHKPKLEIGDVSIEMQGYTFSLETLTFKPLINENLPDLIDIVVYHSEFKKEDEDTITTGVLIFLDNYLGELNSITLLDNVTVEARPTFDKDLAPIAKLQEYLIWREKEFIEKYEGTRYRKDNDAYATFESKLQNGMPTIDSINTDLLAWDAKASHPWMCNLTLEYDGSEYNGYPSKEDYRQLDNIENELLQKLKDEEGFLNIGRHTGNNFRDIYFACKDFRKASKVFE